MMDPSAMEGDKRDVRRPMNAFLIFCKRHRSIVREKNPDLDNRSVTRILGDLWANLKDHEKAVYTDLAKQYKDAFMKANPDYKWHNPEKTTATQKPGLGKPTNMKVLKTEMDLLPEGSIMPGKLADPSNMGGLSLLLMAGQHSDTDSRPTEVPPSTSFADHTGGSTMLDNDKGHVTKITELSGSENTFSDLPKKENVSGVNGDSRTGIVGGGECEAGKPSCKVTNGGKPVKVTTEPVWKIDGKLIENQTKRDTPPQTVVIEGQQTKDLMTVNYSLLELAEMCSNQLGTNKPAAPMKYGDLSTKPLLRQAIAAPKVPHRSLLTEAFMDTCDKGNYSEILRDKSAGSKSKTSLENQLRSSEETLEKSLDHGPDEKENISKLIVTEVKDTQENSEEESSMIKCGKLVVNHIIDKLFSSDIATAVKKASENNNSDPLSESNGIAKLEVECENVLKAADNRDDSKDDVKETMSSECSEQFNEDIYDEHDGCKENEVEPADDRKTIIDAKKEVSDTGDGSLETKTLDAESENKLKDEKQDLTKLKDRKRLYCPPPISRESEGGEVDGEETEEFHPVRKSRRRNRGQRYQELINEGIIQPSKERMAALQQHPATDDGGEEEDFQTIDTYILPETAIRRIRKRTTSESAKDKMVQMEDAKRYKTGDFDLEAHIATLPACSVEAMGRKRGFIRQRHSSECSHVKKSPDDHPLPDMASPRVFDIEKTVSLPPHVKLPSPEKTTEPVVGSRKRKARKHSINHLLPAPPSIFNSASNIKLRPYESGATEGSGCHGISEHENSHNKSEDIVNQDIKLEREVFVDTGHVLDGSDKKSVTDSEDGTDKFDKNKNRLSCSEDKGSVSGSVTDFKCAQNCGAGPGDMLNRGKSDLLENQSVVRGVSDPRTVVSQTKEEDSLEPVSDDVMHETEVSKTDGGTTGDTNRDGVGVRVVEMDTVSGIGRPCGSNLVVGSSQGLDPTGLASDTVVESGIPV